MGITSNDLEITLDRFEYKLPENMYVMHKVSTGFKYKLKHSKKEFDSEEKCLNYIDKILSEHNRYLKLVDALTLTELSKLFSEEVLLGLSPTQIKEYETIEQFKYKLVVDDEWNIPEFSSLEEVKNYVADMLGLTFHWDYDLVSTDGKKVMLEGEVK